MDDTGYLISHDHKTSLKWKGAGGVREIAIPELGKLPGGSRQVKEEEI